MQVFHIVPEPGGEVCDFCTSRPIFKRYSCRNFLVPRTKHWVFQHESVGAWAACRKCAELIDAENWTELSDRALRRFVKKHGPIGRYDEFPLRAQFRELHQLFREHS